MNDSQYYLTRLDNCLNDLMNQANIPAAIIQESMQYCLFPGGKRLRPLLVYFSGEITNAPIESIDYIAAAIEMTHCYSLIHDDLPAMDDDDLRRGKPSCHKAFDEATAILTGDALQAFAIESLLNNLPHSLSLEKAVAIPQLLLKASGPAGMVSGQSLDLTHLSHRHISEQEIIVIHQLKTGQLIEACIQMAIVAGNPTRNISDALLTFAKHLGLLFQMQDDYMDRYQSEQLKKGRSSDSANQKTTYASIMEQQQLFDTIEKHYKKAFSAIKPLGKLSEKLSRLLHELHHLIEFEEKTL